MIGSWVRGSTCAASTGRCWWTEQPFQLRLSWIGCSLCGGRLKRISSLGCKTKACVHRPCASPVPLFSSGIPRRSLNGIPAATCMYRLKFVHPTHEADRVCVREAVWEDFRSLRHFTKLGISAVQCSPWRLRSSPTGATLSSTFAAEAFSSILRPLAQSGADAVVAKPPTTLGTVHKPRCMLPCVFVEHFAAASSVCSVRSIAWQAVRVA